MSRGGVQKGLVQFLTPVCHRSAAAQNWEAFAAFPESCKLESIHGLSLNPILGKLELVHSIESIAFFQLKTSGFSRARVCPALGVLRAVPALGGTSLFVQAAISQVFSMFRRTSSEDVPENMA